MAGATDGKIEIAVEPRKPRLAWRGMDRDEVAPVVPAQVVEIVCPRASGPAQG